MFSLQEMPGPLPGLVPMGMSGGRAGAGEVWGNRRLPQPSMMLGCQTVWSLQTAIRTLKLRGLLSLMVKRTAGHVACGVMWPRHGALCQDAQPQVLQAGPCPGDSQEPASSWPLLVLNPQRK